MTAELDGGDWIRGITIRQPWATCILAGKTTENRPGNWPWRGWFLLHAGKQLDRLALREPLVATTIRGRELHLGAVIGVARLIDCHLDQGPEYCPGPWAERDVHHLVLTDVHELPLPVPATGALPAWKPEQDLVDQVLQQLPHLRL
ncbi:MULTISPECIES: hypothetical protein [unclassified Streptomyces]|uniref:hypothetical protein n=1 Tax=unclassified Streptomyces TaxID=2593676 RepID=UPI002E1AB722|nr:MULTISPECIES: hypothetical protein [unclassified Streptomyces]WSX47446.1 hypothetical protein OG760_37740 [Streptomyces sp. NBC_00963]